MLSKVLAHSSAISAMNFQHILLETKKLLGITDLQVKMRSIIEVWQRMSIIYSLLYVSNLFISSHFDVSDSNWLTEKPLISINNLCINIELTIIKDICNDGSYLYFEELIFYNCFFTAMIANAWVDGKRRREWMPNV